MHPNDSFPVRGATPNISVRIEHCTTETYVVWHGERILATYTGDNGLQKAEEAAERIKQNQQPQLSQVVDCKPSTRLQPIDTIERDARHFDGAWDTRDSSRPLADRLLEAAAEFLNSSDLESSFQLLHLSRAALRHEQAARYGKRYKSGSRRAMTTEQVELAKRLREKSGWSWGRISKALRASKSTVRRMVTGN